MTRFKFCGLSDEDEVELASHLGADLVGFVVQAPKSHRDVSVEEACHLVSITPPETETVLVTPATDEKVIHGDIALIRPDIIQLSGPVTDELVQEIVHDHGVGVWRTYHPTLDPTTEEERLERFAESCDALVLDAVDHEGYGGKGEVLDWQVARDRVEHLAGFPVVLAGGLHPGNVQEAIDWVRPWCVDVSSGIETEGTKDPAKMRAFAEAVQEMSR